MTFNLTKLFAGAAALTVAATLVASAAHAETAPEQPLQNYQVVPSDGSDLCGFKISDDKRRTLYVVYGAKDHMTALVYEEQDIPDLTGRKFPVTLQLDKDQYDMTAAGAKGGIVLVSNDDSVPAALIVANLITVTTNGATIFSVASDKNFDTAMEESVLCSQTHK